MHEVNIKGALVFWSQWQWDVAALARIFYTLGVGREEDAEFRKLVDILRQVTDDSKLPLQLVSVKVWEDLSPLQDQVLHITPKSTEDGKAKLQAVLKKIDIVHGQGP